MAQVRCGAASAPSTYKWGWTRCLLKASKGQPLCSSHLACLQRGTKVWMWTSRDEKGVPTKTWKLPWEGRVARVAATGFVGHFEGFWKCSCGCGLMTTRKGVLQCFDCGKLVEAKL